MKYAFTLMAVWVAYRAGWQTTLDFWGFTILAHIYAAVDLLADRINK